MSDAGQQNEQGIATYCLGVGCMRKCETCQHEKNWQALNQLPNALRLSIQREAKRMDNDFCQLTNGKLYQEPSK